MILFIISFCLVLLSSYFITSIISPKKDIVGLMYFPILAFAQVVLTFELLSLFTEIKVPWVLGLNLLFFSIICFIWFKKSKPLWSFNCRGFLNKILNSFKLDKSLIFLFIGYSVFIVSAITLCILLPITSADAQGYHVARSVFWALQGNLNHFDIPDIRDLCLPINSEILYTWVFLFVKKDVFLACFSFIGYVFSMISLYNILGYLRYCVRKRLWVIFILSSFASVLVQASGTETDIIISALVLSSIFLFWYALKHNKIIPIYIASLSYALAVGTKTTAIIAIPGVGLFLLALCIIHKKYKSIAWFLGFGLINFLIFSSYNYILNFIHFGNFMGSDSFIVVSKNYYGIKGMIANFIKHFFLFLDFTGFTWSKFVGANIMNIKSNILLAMHLDYIKDGLYSVGGINNYLLEPLMGAGILGFLTFLPCLAWALIKPIFKFKTKRIWVLFGFGCLFIVNILVMSYLLAYMAYSVRFIMTFMVLSSPILIYSYLSKRNPFKYIIIAFALFYLILVSTNLWARPFVNIIRILHINPSISRLRDIAVCKSYTLHPNTIYSSCALKSKIENDYSKDNKILIFLPAAEYLSVLKQMEFNGYHIDFGRLENIKNIDLNKYNIIVATKKGQAATYFTDYALRKDEISIINGDYVQNKKELVPCVYNYNYKIPKISNGKELAPYNVRCIMSPEFIQKNHLKLFGITGVIKPLEHEYDYFQIFENENNPIIRKDKVKNQTLP